MNHEFEKKDSELEYIGIIPADWSIKKLKYLANIDFSTVDRHTYKEEKTVYICHYPDVYKNEYINKKTKLPTGTCNDSEFVKFALRKGDIVLTKVEIT